MLTPKILTPSRRFYPNRGKTGGWELKN